MADGVAAAALVFEGTAAGAGSIAPDWGGFQGRCRFRWVDDLGDAEVGVEFFESRVSEGGGEGGGALGFDEFDDLHSGLETDRGRG